MIDIVFSDSALGSLKSAQSYGLGSYSGGMGVSIISPDGHGPTGEEIFEAQREAEARARLEWERGTPMGGSMADVYGFAYGLSVGDISERVPGEKRRQVLDWLYGIYPDPAGEPAFTTALMRKGSDTLAAVLVRVQGGEGVRIWYSSQPDELCGMYWFMAQLDRLEPGSGQVTLVELPDREPDEAGGAVNHSGWGGIGPGQWHGYLDRARAVTPGFCRACAQHWAQLEAENAPLRACLNGRLVSVPETLYDGFILRELARQDDEFHEATLIGLVLGKYALGIGDAWIAHRLEGLIEAGQLIPVTQPPPDGPIYHRRLKKCGSPAL